MRAPAPSDRFRNGKAGRPVGSSAPRRRPESSTMKDWRALGYMTPAEAARAAGIAASTVYNRIRRGDLAGEIGGKKVVVKTTMGVIWVLAEALAIVQPSPADASAAPSEE